MLLRIQHERISEALVPRSSAIAIARAYPNVRVDGFDLDTSSIELARQNALDAGVSDRVTFERRDAADPFRRRRDRRHEPDSIATA